MAETCLERSVLERPGANQEDLCSAQEQERSRRATGEQNKALQLVARFRFQANLIRASKYLQNQSKLKSSSKIYPNHAFGTGISISRRGAHSETSPKAHKTARKRATENCVWTMFGVSHAQNRTTADQVVHS